MKTRLLVGGTFAPRIEVACQALRLLWLENTSSMRGWTSFALKPGKSSNTGCVPSFCNCCNKSGCSLPRQALCFSAIDTSTPQEAYPVHATGVSAGRTNYHVP